MKENDLKYPIRILNVVPNMRSAGIENFIMNMYRHIDRSKIQFDFLVHDENRQVFDDEIESLGGKIYRLSYKNDKNIFKYKRDLNTFFRSHPEYKIIHGHMQSMMPMYLHIAKKCGVPYRIAHSHNANYEKTAKGFILHLFSRFSKYPANIHYACSFLAGKYLYGKTNFEVIYNSINIDKFLFDSKVREEVREELNIKDKFVIGHIARFELQKNHSYLIDIFKKISEKNENAVLLLIGEGKLVTDMKRKVKELNLTDKVFFLGLRKDANRLYQAMDCFVLPSLYEGLPVVGIEAQVSGLPCFFSNTITKELDLTKQAHFLTISSTNQDNWCREILKSAKSKRSVDRDFWINSSYNILVNSKQLEEKYESMLERL